ncbi:hypothetical protein PNOK_0448400 [Pyrrhoderma noxium]|uniref:Uncharacterized protein n=1 Tax=Pyrrhoderma noxium TaxID=2282107 RepID=A0A286UIY6_9AGAM|nr:hypothetical protein PNOK_0448400 [Pyrrhoderma noxium]
MLPSSSSYNYTFGNLRSYNFIASFVSSVIVKFRAIEEAHEGLKDHVSLKICQILKVLKADKYVSESTAQTRYISKSQKIDEN